MSNDSKPVINGSAAIQTASGGRFDPLAPADYPIDIQDIAHSLSNLCRFGGHCSKFYSVAQHSQLTSRWLDLSWPNLSKRDRRDLCLWGLLHDAAEAYIGDWTRPLKRRMWVQQYGQTDTCSLKGIELSILEQVAKTFGLSWPMPKAVEIADVQMLAAERMTLMARSWEWTDLVGVSPAAVPIEPWPPSLAFRGFMKSFETLLGADTTK